MRNTDDPNYSTISLNSSVGDGVVDLFDFSQVNNLITQLSGFNLSVADNAARYDIYADPLNLISNTLGLDTAIFLPLPVPDHPGEPPLPAVSVPAAIWLFGTGILGLIGFSKRRKAA